MFVAVITAGSFAEASKQLGVSNSQASKLISKLEADLGVQLLKRTTRALSLTEVGSGYFERIRALLEELDAIDNSVRNIAGAPTGKLRITAPLSFGQMRLMPLLLAFVRAFPDIQLDVDLSDDVRNVVDGGFDMAVRIGNPEDSSLIARKLCDARIVLVASPAYLERRGTPEKPDDLTGYDCIIDTNFRDPLNWRFRSPEGASRVVTVAGGIRISNGEACLAAAEAGLGVALSPSFIAKDSIETGRVTRLLQDWEDQPFGVYAIYPPARHLALKVRALVDFLITSINNGPE
jgi:DNA-binding transcriptional LysR family regulator